MSNSPFPLPSCFHRWSLPHPVSPWYLQVASMILILHIPGNSASCFLANHPRTCCHHVPPPNSESCHAPYGLPCTIQCPRPDSCPPQSAAPHTPAYLRGSLFHLFCFFHLPWGSHDHFQGRWVGSYRMYTFGPKSIVHTDYYLNDGPGIVHHAMLVISICPIFF